MKPLPSALRALPLLCSLGSIALAACGPKSTAGEAVRPKEMRAGDALRGDGASADCSPSDDDRSLIVDLRTEDRKDMETMLRQGRIPVVSYDCKDMKLLRRCSLEAKFEYLGASPRKNVRSIENTDAIAAEVPLASASLKASVQAGRKVDIALAEVGTRASSFELVAKQELKGVEAGDCDAATHFVRAVDVGAFAIAQRTSGEAAAAAAIFSASASGDSKSAMSSMNSEGKLDACERAKESDDDAPEGCRVPLRVHLRRVSADAKEKEAKAQEAANAQEKASGGDSPFASKADPPCPEGKVRAEGGSCVAPSPNIRYQCRSNDVAECRTQCDKGHLGSCERLGTLLLYGLPAAKPGEPPKMDRDPKAAIAILEKACDVKNRDAELRGCSALAHAYRSALMPIPKPPTPGSPPPPPPKPPTDAERKEAHDKGVAVLDVACKRLDAIACYNLANAHENGMGPVVKGDADRAMHYYKRACSLGNVSGCLTAARLYVEGKKNPDGSEAVRKSPAEGLAILDNACKQNASSACSQLATYLTTDKYKVKDVKRAAGIFQMLCERKSLSGCSEYALLQVRGEGGVKADPKAARETLEQLCFESRVSAACYGVGLLKETGAGGVAEDKAKAVEYYKDHAYVKDAAARAARLLETGAKGVAKNPDEAGELYGRACNMLTNSDPVVCKKAAAHREKTSSPFSSRIFYDHACKLGDKASCDKVRAFSQGPPPPPGAGKPPPPPPPAKKT